MVSTREPRAGAADMDLDTAVPSTFEPFLKSRFVITLPDGRKADLVLIEVTGPPAGTDVRPFQVVFRGGPTPPSGQGMARLSHETAGVLELFLVPATPDGDAPCYVAVLA